MQKKQPPLGPMVQIQEDFLRGKIVSGMGWAHRTLPRQLPFFIPFIPELKDFPPATINVEMDFALSFAKSDLIIKDVPWCEGVQESFEFFQIVLFYRGKEIPAWLYRPIGSLHRLNPCDIEIMAPFHIIHEPGDEVKISFVNRLVKNLEWKRIE